MEQVVREGGCVCGKIRYQVRGGPTRAGLCHCGDCKKESGSSFVTFAVWPHDRFICSGGYATYEGRSFCPTCGSRLFCLSKEEAELRVGSLDDAPNNIPPDYEIWSIRRECWLKPAVSLQFEQDKPHSWPEV
ncbi:GFA family protein [Phyllobacterium sp. SB3]|uniref:GFA family protein n=1 Tax=Phyllobacterium sp. SB3 TaxID=3156073 RepID=UPI0032AF487F